MKRAEPFRTRARTKIVATLGPASCEPRQIEELIAVGADVFRINFAHGSRQEHQQTIDRIRAAAGAAGRPIGILVDLAGPKIRLGELPGGEMSLVDGAQYRIVRAATSAGTDELTTNYAPLLDELDEGDAVMLADGTASLVVEHMLPDEAICRVIQPGVVRTRQGVNLPGVKISAPALGEIDLDNARFAAEAGVDFVSLSFVRSAAEVRQLKDLLQSCGSKADVIAKIEKEEALDALDEIVETADGIMIARGDLGVEIDVARMPIVQKQIIETCHRIGRPVIVATQMLDSMQHARRPTRAEATDVANAILDGADACMLSGETAMGEHPRLTVETMNRIMLETEPRFAEHKIASPDNTTSGRVLKITEAVAYGAGRIAQRLAASMIVVISQSGASALAVSRQRNLIPTIGVSSRPDTLRRMSLYWGVVPLPDIDTGDDDADNRDTLLSQVDDWGCRDGCIAPGDIMVLVTGNRRAEEAHNILEVRQVRGG